MTVKQAQGLTAPDGSQYVTITDGAGNLGVGVSVTVGDGSGPLTVDGTVAATQSGTWTVQPGNTANTTAWKVDGSAVTQPVSLASVPSHAVTNAGTFATQSAITAASGSIASGAIASGALASGSMVDLITFQGTKAAGTAAANSLLVGNVYNSTVPALTTGQQVAYQCDTTGSSYVNNEGRKATYRTGLAGIAQSANGILFVIQGSASKLVKVTRVAFSGSLTTAGLVHPALYRTSGDVSSVTGTTTLSPGKMVSGSAGATAVCKTYTAATIGSGSVELTAKAGMLGSATVPPTMFEWTFGDKNTQAMTLNGTGEYLQLFISSGSYTGASFDVEIEFTEE